MSTWKVTLLATLAVLLVAVGIVVWVFVPNFGPVRDATSTRPTSVTSSDDPASGSGEQAAPGSAQPRSESTRVRTPATSTEGSTPSASASEAGRLSQVALSCGQPALVRDDGQTLSLVLPAVAGATSERRVASGGGWGTLECLLEGLEAPDQVVAHIGPAWTIDGTQTEEWAGIKVRRTYDPNSGTTITFNEAR